MIRNGPGWDIEGRRQGGRLACQPEHRHRVLRNGVDPVLALPFGEGELRVWTDPECGQVVVLPGDTRSTDSVAIEGAGSESIDLCLLVARAQDGEVIAAAVDEHATGQRDRRGRAAEDPERTVRPKEATDGLVPAADLLAPLPGGRW